MSIITPTYNHERFILDCIQSVLGQTVSNWEMIIVDDGSTDRTVELALAVGDPRISVIALPNRGIQALAESYNTALEKSSAEIIAILEGDDFWPLDKLQTQLPDFDEPLVVLSSGFFLDCTESKDVLTLLPLDLPNEAALNNSPVGSSSLAMLSPQFLTFTFPVSTLIRKVALIAAGGFVQPFGLPLVDFPTFLNLGLQGEWRFHRRVLGYWRRHGQSITKNKYALILDGVYKVCEEFSQTHYGELPNAAQEIPLIDRQWLNRQIQRATILHRLNMSLGQGTRASAAAKLALSYPVGPKSRLLLLAAYLTTQAGLQTEWLFKLVKRRPWQLDYESHGGDRCVNPETEPNELPYRHLGK